MSKSDASIVPGVSSVNYLLPDRLVGIRQQDGSVSAKMRKGMQIARRFDKLRKVQSREMAEHDGEGKGGYPFWITEFSTRACFLGEASKLMNCNASRNRENNKWINIP